MYKVWCFVSLEVFNQNQFFRGGNLQNRGFYGFYRFFAAVFAVSQQKVIRKLLSLKEVLHFCLQFFCDRVFLVFFASECERLQRRDFLFVDFRGFRGLVAASVAFFLGILYRPFLNKRYKAGFFACEVNKYQDNAGDYRARAQNRDFIRRIVAIFAIFQVFAEIPA